MSNRAPYSRVYWSIIDDERFADVYDSDALLGLWLRLLLIADQAWPASALLPSGLRRKNVQILRKAGLLEAEGGRKFRVHGLDAERERRSLAATSRGPNGTQTGRSLAEPRQAEPMHRPEVVMNDFDRRVAATQKMLRETGRLHD